MIRCVCVCGYMTIYDYVSLCVHENKMRAIEEEIRGGVCVGGGYMTIYDYVNLCVHENKMRVTEEEKERHSGLDDEVCVCLRKYVYIHRHTHACVHICIQARRDSNASKYTCIHTYTHMHVHTCRQGRDSNTLTN
jgi:hypothetical protein